MITLNLKLILKRKLLKDFTNIFIALVLVTTMISSVINAQTFDSGSDGSDGALNFSNVAPGTTVIFDPTAFDPPLDPDNDRIFHFTTITIPADITVRFPANTLFGLGPVFWLTSGAVQIDGTLDLDGEEGDPGNVFGIPSIPGTGGFGGGIGAGGNRPPQPGFGPGGGRVNAFGWGGGGAGHAVDGIIVFSNLTQGIAYGNDFLVPLQGGSGGSGGGKIVTHQGGGGGGAGGGAIMIASSTSIVVNGTISAKGGNGGSGSLGGGGGSGGGIRLIAPVISIDDGAVNADGGQGGVPQGGHASRGRIRLEAFQGSFTGTITPDPLLATPGSVQFLPDAEAPTVRVVAVAGVPVSQFPTASFIIPDVTMNTNAPVTLDIEAHFIPPGTVVQLTIIPETGSQQVVESDPLQGTFEESTATASVTVPTGLSRFTVQATWEQ